MDHEPFEVSEARIKYGNTSWTGFMKPGEFCILKLEELKDLYRILEHHYIPYEDERAHAVVNKIMKVIKENDARS